MDMQLASSRPGLGTQANFTLFFTLNNPSGLECTWREGKVMLLPISCQCLAHSRRLIKYLSNERVNSPFYQSALGRGVGQGGWPGRFRPWTKGP